MSGKGEETVEQECFKEKTCRKTGRIDEKSVETTMNEFKTRLGEESREMVEMDYDKNGESGYVGEEREQEPEEELLPDEGAKKVEVQGKERDKEDNLCDCEQREKVVEERKERCNFTRVMLVILVIFLGAIILLEPLMPPLDDEE